MFKTILVHLRGTKGDSAALAAALQIAQPFASHLECFHIRPSVAELVSKAMTVDRDEDTSILSTMMGDLRKETADTSGRAFEAFTAFCTKEDIPRAELPPAPSLSAAFRERIGHETDLLIEQSRYRDLVVLKGGYEEAGGLGRNALGHIIVNAGRPVLLAPTVPAGPIRTVAVAWKDTPEAARAVTAALPILQIAEKVFVFTASEEDEPMSNYEGVVEQLSWYGISATPHHVIPSGRDVYDSVLETARAAEADLLITGAYGHNRFSEVVFGGFTEGLLEDASIPVLLLH